MCRTLATGSYVQSSILAGLPTTHSLRIFDALELKFTPFKFVLYVELTL